MPDMQPLRPKEKTSTMQEEPENEMDDYFDTRSTTRASEHATSGSTSMKRKSMTFDEHSETKKQQAATTILNFYNTTINTHTLSGMSTPPRSSTPKKKMRLQQCSRHRGRHKLLQGLQ
eukprot:341423-Amphidinium_carterae.2